MKKSFPLLRAFGLSAGLIASTAMMAPAQAATSGTISATGTIVANVCNVSGANVQMIPYDNNAHLRTNSAETAPPRGGDYSSNSGETTISLSAITLQAPPGANATGIINAAFYDEFNPGEPISTIEVNSSTGGALTFQVPPDQNGNTPGVSGYYTVDANVGNGSLLPAGSYTLTSTITCVAR